MVIWGQGPIKDSISTSMLFGEGNGKPEALRSGTKWRRVFARGGSCRAGAKRSV